MNSDLQHPTRSSLLYRDMVAHPLDSRQEELTKQFILPDIEEISADFKALRDAVDIEVERCRSNGSHEPCHGSDSRPGGFCSPFDPGIVSMEVRKGLQEMSKQQLEIYPVGACLAITRMVFRLFQHGSIVTCGQGFSTLREFIQAGGLFHIIWGSIRDIYFQTAFQVGSFYLDVANNTVDPLKEKVVHAFLSDSGFKNILSYDGYIPIRRGYHEVSLHLNTCFPELLPYYPLLAVSEKDGLISLDTSPFMAGLNMETRFRTVVDAVLSGITDPDLDKSTLERLAWPLKKMSGAKDKHRWMTFDVMTQAEMVRRLEHLAESVDPSQGLERFKAAEKTAQAMNVIWNLNRITAQ